MDYSKAIFNIRQQLENYLVENKLKSLVIGLSGGIDSSLCTVLAAPVCRKLGIKLIGRSLTIETNKPDEIHRGRIIGENFCDDFAEIDLTQAYFELKNSIEESDIADENEREKKIRLGNIKVRIRMIYLYNLAQKYKGMVLSTDNYTELLLGFWTLHGDVGDYGMIQPLWKTEVYEMSEFLIENELETTAQKNALKRSVDAVPTDGLGITNSDLDQIQASSYYEVDTILKEFFVDEKHKNHPVIKRHLASEFKRKNPYNLSRKQIFE
ncbi:MAG: NAD(+) synthase [Bacteroidetes bacterium GWF2_33_38]|nr:MAG: NAD(+) synthase [Bacteroidetes bacterium GWF2_33_38]OFY76148.1 MAG: NAD(+) synthase [Bacteroidetes bacterium RIFOXYA12_FULL_33_9]OFY91711.1 MAG: NAD(+) synthase [Bacteroidetes bacterium RIFOXYA2_FULL_33_7]